MRREKEKRVVYYSDPLNEEFSEAQIKPRVIDGAYCYAHGRLWDLCSLVIQNACQGTVPADEVSAEICGPGKTEKI